MRATAELTLITGHAEAGGYATEEVLRNVFLRPWKSKKFDFGFFCLARCLLLLLFLVSASTGE